SVSSTVTDGLLVWSKISAVGPGPTVQLYDRVSDSPNDRIAVSRPGVLALSALFNLEGRPNGCVFTDAAADQSSPFFSSSIM
ncbi:hypothetical protein, partial [Klebsiella pneumoniae]|uniref:hypothetical protein n=1 Tax=Klebsiella pneumoniae TaxID=573 RepID=UPI003969B484